MGATHGCVPYFPWMIFYGYDVSVRQSLLYHVNLYILLQMTDFHSIVIIILSRFGPDGPLRRQTSLLPVFPMISSQVISTMISVWSSGVCHAFNV
jgi:hypothetical protein